MTRRIASLLALALTGPLAAQDAAPPAPRAKVRAVLVEASGPKPEAEKLVSSLLLELSDAGVAVPVDARLAGASFADARTAGNPNGERFRKDWPADLYVGVVASPCETKRRDVSMPTTNAYGATQMRLISTVDVLCGGEVTVVGADGKSVASVKAEGSMRADAEALTSAEASGTFGPAWEEAAKKAAKKLRKALGK